MSQAYVEPLTYLELYARRKAFNISWRHPPAHSWYRREGPGVTIHFKRDRKDQTALAHLTSGNLKTLFVVIRSSISAQSATCLRPLRNIYLTVLPWCIMTCLRDRISCWR
ncbi:hypothetical protein AVEN_96274-1 [Araneus ventricosus]|uniref:Uncharacterized protein n=1 Tax=Araneus ventricosus TaxID=182803 RepID=A0A4Y2P3V6_ARAVE|nr:hypothetical protein AVEN_96274-1 [Araneus ventricosus]